MAPPKPGVIPLRPLNLGEVLDGAFQAARRNGKAMFGSAVIFQVVAAAVTLVVMAVGFGQVGLSLMNGGYFAEASSEPSAEALDSLLGSVLPVLAGLVVVQFLSVLAQMVLQGALVIPVLRATLNRTTSFGQMWRLARPRVPSLLGLALLYTAAGLVAMALYGGILVGIIFAVGGVNSGGGALAAVGLGILLSLPFLAAGIWVSIKLLLAPAAIVCENLGVVAALKRSWQLTQQNWWRTFGITALAAVIASVIAGIVSAPVGILLSLLVPLMVPNPGTEQVLTQMWITQGISGLVGALVGAVTLAFQSGVMALIYVDLRMRRDGFDVILLKEAESGTDDGAIPGNVPASPSSAAGFSGPYPPAGYPGA
ncbi:hypothetical protein [Arthrobacter cryoconiti]|uniref:DUF7847 domain-containing protein n=1 Tax=Arthrobacter cryoconiti TaxID=748907 RepID=A0ABV8QYK9_9MICC|nr:hypothetical protein [Arthrobacter cryoconiti]MCC9068436.1 hypothetical protein [Arthrobacter cryoconiti]